MTTEKLTTPITTMETTSEPLTTQKTTVVTSEPTTSHITTEKLTTPFTTMVTTSEQVTSQTAVDIGTTNTLTSRAALAASEATTNEQLTTNIGTTEKLTTSDATNFWSSELLTTDVLSSTGHILTTDPTSDISTGHMPSSSGTTIIDNVTKDTSVLASFTTSFITTDISINTTNPGSYPINNFTLASATSEKQFTLSLNFTFMTTPSLKSTTTKQSFWSTINPVMDGLTVPPLTFEKPCPPITRTPHFAQISQEYVSTSLVQVVIVMCLEGYQLDDLTSSRTIVCLPNGQWHIQLPDCKGMLQCHVISTYHLHA